MADAGDEDVLVVNNAGGFEGEREGGALIAPLTHTNACALRGHFPFTAPVKVLSRDLSCGTGDRLGIAGPGHIRVFERCGVTPVLAQQSMRELNLTNRTYEGVIDAATFSAFRAGYKQGFGADGDHLKTTQDIRMALDAGCTMITLDLSDHIRPPHPAGPDAAAESMYLNRAFIIEGEEIRYTVDDLNEARAVYGAAIAFTRDIYGALFAGDGSRAQLEVSIDETSAATTPQQHFFIASELHRLGVDFASLAPRFTGEFQKGVDYKGDIAAFERDFKTHAAISRHFGYKLSIHSGSDKFSVFPIIQRHAGGRFHLKTAGTSWLEAMRVVAGADPALYRESHALALQSFAEASQYYRVTANLAQIPPLEKLQDGELPSLLNQDDARQLIHITYGLILADPFLKRRLYALWRRERRAYADALYRHLGRHIELITGTPLGSS
jgi:hypothetical protein